MLAQLAKLKAPDANRSMRRRKFITLLGGAAAMLRSPALHAEEAARRHRVGFLALIPGEDKTLLPALLERLHELGYNEKTNLSFIYRSAEGHPERLAALASEIIDERPDVLIAGFGTLTARAAKTATSSVPVVFVTVGDPLGAGIVASLSRPGGNVTGLSDQARDVQGKRLQLLLELIGDKRTIAALLNPDTPFSQLALTEVRAAADQAHVPLQVLEARTADAIVQHIEQAATTPAAGLLILEDPLIYSIRARIAELAMRLHLPSMFVYRDSAEAGGLLAYGPDRRHLYRRAADYVGRILKGTKPGDLPVEQPTKFEFVINLRTARALGLTVPDKLLALADDLLE